MLRLGGARVDVRIIFSGLTRAVVGTIVHTVSIQIDACYIGMENERIKRSNDLLLKFLCKLSGWSRL